MRSLIVAHPSNPTAMPRGFSKDAFVFTYSPLCFMLCMQLAAGDSGRLLHRGGRPGAHGQGWLHVCEKVP